MVRHNIVLDLPNKFVPAFVSYLEASAVCSATGAMVPIKLFRVAKRFSVSPIRRKMKMELTIT